MKISPIESNKCYIHCCCIYDICIYESIRAIKPDIDVLNIAEKKKVYIIQLIETLKTITISRDVYYVLTGLATLTIDMFTSHTIKRALTSL